MTKEGDEHDPRLPGKKLQRDLWLRADQVTKRAARMVKRVLAAGDEQMISRTSVWVSILVDRMTKEYSREWLETELRNGLRAGRLKLTVKAVEAADKGDEIADAALRTVYAEMVGGTFPQRGPGHLQVWAYGQRAVLRAPHKRPRGRRWYDHWVRDIDICVLIHLVCYEFGVRPSRNRAARRARSEPSAISLVVAALARHQIHLDESSVQENLWFGLPGELVRGILSVQ
jgi:hypothetical protein